MNLNKPAFQDFGRKTFLAWFRYSRAFFVLVFFLAIGFGVLSWYDNVYHGDWTEDEKTSYAKANFQETVFREGEFRKAVEAAEKRARQHAESSGVSNDFFAPIPGVGKDKD